MHAREHGHVRIITFVHGVLPGRRLWLWQWRHWLSKGARRATNPATTAKAAMAAAAAAAASKPEPLTHAVREFFCPCHPHNPKLRVRPPGVVAKRSK